MTKNNHLATFTKVQSKSMIHFEWLTASGPSVIWSQSEFKEFINLRFIKICEKNISNRIFFLLRNLFFKVNFAHQFGSFEVSDLFLLFNRF